MPNGGASTAYRDTRHVALRNTGFGYALRDSLLTDLYSATSSIFSPDELVALCERVELEADIYYEAYVEEKVEEASHEHEAEKEELEKVIADLKAEVMTLENHKADLEHRLGQANDEITQLDDQLSEAKTAAFYPTRKLAFRP